MKKTDSSNMDAFHRSMLSEITLKKKKKAVLTILLSSNTQQDEADSSGSGLSIDVWERTQGTWGDLGDGNVLCFGCGDKPRWCHFYPIP